MKLHRLTLTNYRGISHREIEFPDRGVVVISGANEIGKSSMIEALDLLFDARDRSTKKEVKQVKPTHADVGSEITAEISTGAYRFIYRKRFHKRFETHLTVLAPRRHELSGDEAHDRVRAILAETVDVDLWHAQRVLQSAPTAAVDLSGSDALSRALDVAAGQAAQLSGAEPLLIDRIDAEYQRYFTPTGRPTGEWAAAVRRLRNADDEVARCATLVSEVDDAVRRHSVLTAELAVLTGERDEVRLLLAGARADAEVVAQLTGQLKEAEVVAAAAAAKHAAAVAALTERRRLRADIEERTVAVSALAATAAEAAEAEATAREVHGEADAIAESARATVESGQARVDAARLHVERLALRDEADRLVGRLAKIDGARRELERAETELAGIALTDASMRAIEDAAAAVERATGRLDAASVRIELIASADVEVRIAGESLPLTAGTVWSDSTAAPMDVELPGVLTARVLPGVPALDRRAELQAAQQILTTALEAGRVSDVAAARAVDGRRRELAAARDRTRATLVALVAEDTVEQLRARLVELARDLPGDVPGDSPGDGALFEIGATGPADPAAARAELDAAVSAHRQALTDAETHRKVAAAAANRLGESTTHASVLREKLAVARAELTACVDRLAVRRDAVSDDQLAVTAQADGDENRRATARIAELGGQLAAAAPDTVAAALDHAVRRVDAVAARHDETAEALREASTQLKVYGTQGRKGQLDAAETEREHAESEHQRVQRRARAAEMLREVVVRHRDATRARYAEPFRGEVERLGRIVFGDTFEVEVDSRLRICTRTLAGRTVPYDSLSGGAKEQLGIVARLAGAALVAKEDGVPIVIDDALGFTDPDRLIRMGAVFDMVGGDGQVIVLTCSPQRYAGVGAAHHVVLTA